MFSLASGVYQAYMAPQQINILVVGAQSVGKTTLLERIKVTQFDRHKKPPSLNNRPQLAVDLVRGDDPPRPRIVAKKPRPTKGWGCPAPAKYQKAADDDSEEEMEEPSPAIPTPREHSDRHSSMESVDLTSAETTPNQTAPATRSSPQHDLKKGSKMLPLTKIRPTIGMNLAKLDICGAKCHIMDVGGRLETLWERYYDDCDALIFVWRLTNHHHSEPSTDDDRSPPPSTSQQEALLATVRSNIPPEVPFLILLHDFHDSAHADQIYGTQPWVLPRFASPLQSLAVTNAATGQGVRCAMEWLVPIAKQQQRVRDIDVLEEDDRSA